MFESYTNLISPFNKKIFLSNKILYYNILKTTRSLLGYKHSPSHKLAGTGEEINITKISKTVRTPDGLGALRDLIHLIYGKIIVKKLKQSLVKYIYNLLY